MHVLIAGINYRPEVTGIGAYTAGVAEHLARRGDRVTVITGLPHYPSWRLAHGRRHRLWSREWIAGVEVIRAAHYVPATQSALRRAAYEATFSLTGLLAMPTLPRPDAIVGITPSLGGAVLARLAGQRFGSPYGILFQDLMGPAAAQSGVPGGGAVARAVGAAEAWALQRATAVAVVADVFAPYLVGLGVLTGAIHRVPNWSRASSATMAIDEVRTHFGWNDGRMLVLHSGNIGFKQGLEQVVDAARLATDRKEPIRFVIAGDGSRAGAIRESALGLTNLEFLRVQSEGVHASLLAVADVLLLCERPSQLGMSLPSKLTSYFAAGRPIVAAVPAGGASSAEVERSEAGLVVPAGAPGALLDTLRRLREDPALAARLGAAGAAFASANTTAADCLLRAERFVDAVAGRRLTLLEAAA